MRTCGTQIIRKENSFSCIILPHKCSHFLIQRARLSGQTVKCTPKLLSIITALEVEKKPRITKPKVICIQRKSNRNKKPSRIYTVTAPWHLPNPKLFLEHKVRN